MTRPPSRPGSRTPRRGRVSALLCAAVVALLAGCTGGSQPAPGPGLLAAGNDLSGQSYTVGGKEFTEQLVLCHITILALESAGADTSDSCGMTGTENVRKALTEGDIDMYWEYNGTAWTTHLRLLNPDPDSTRLYQQVRDRDLAQNKIVWLDQTPMNDAYAFAVDSATARRLNIQTVTDMARVLTAPTSTATLCIEPEFAGRPDGWKAVQGAYGFTVPPERLHTQELNSIYEATTPDHGCTFGEVYATDARTQILQLVVLRDDRNSLPKYNAALTISQAAFNRNPAIARVINPIAAALDDATMTELNSEVVGPNPRPPEDVARDWLLKMKFIS